VDPRTYHVEEANRLLPQVTHLTGRVVEVSRQLPELQDELRIAEYRMRRAGAADPERDAYRRAAALLRSAEEDLVRAVGALEEMGVALKDAQIGLVDFLSYREGELVELCWRLGEESVSHWHRIGEGYAGRKPV
jgi:hypothetical protein